METRPRIQPKAASSFIELTKPEFRLKIAVNF